MKKISYFMALAMFLAAACQREDIQEERIPEVRTHYKTLNVGVADEPETRVGFDEDNSFYWHGGIYHKAATSVAAKIYACL